MPFTLSHPALVIPLRRLRMFHVLPLMIGSLIPDLVSYIPMRILWRIHPFFWRFQYSYSHSLNGSITIDLAVGLLLLWLVVTLGRMLTAPVWQPHRSVIRATLDDFAQRSHRWLLAIPSLLVGIWSHLLWDAFTHEGTLVVDRFAWLQQPLFPDTAHEFPLYHALQYGSSVVGLMLMGWWYQRTLQQIQVPVEEVARELRFRWMLLAMSLPCVLIGGALWLFLLPRAYSWYMATADTVRVVLGLWVVSYVLLAMLLRWWRGPV